MGWVSDIYKVVASPVKKKTKSRSGTSPTMQSEDWILLSIVASPKIATLDPPPTIVQPPTFNAGVFKPRRKIKSELSKKPRRESEISHKMIPRPHVRRDTHPKKVQIQSKM